MWSFVMTSVGRYALCFPHGTSCHLFKHGSLTLVPVPSSRSSSQIDAWYILGAQKMPMNNCLHRLRLCYIKTTLSSNLQSTEAALLIYGKLTLCLAFCRKFSAPLHPFQQFTSVIALPFLQMQKQRSPEIRYPSQSLLALGQGWV